MKELTLSEISTAVNGKITEDCTFKGVYTDSRKPVKGGLFIALEGDRFDGHDFIKNAEADGAAAVLCRKKADTGLPVIYVDDTKKALLALAAYYRSKCDVKVVGLTGSVGKTTTKEMTALVMASEYNTIKTQGNLNNDIGMPLTIFTIESDTQAAVIEMGMNHSGEIYALTAVSRPDVGIITNVGVSHIENLGSRENILKAKLEILEGMKKGSTLIINGDNDLLSQVENPDYNIVFFGMENEKCTVKAVDVQQSAEGTECKFIYNNEKYDVYIPIAGVHNVYNALAAFCAGVYTGIEPCKAADAIKAYVPAGMRQKTVKKNGITFIEDCYNASPDSVKAGINTLSSLGAKRTVAVLGDMLELGDYSETAHSQCGEYAARKGIDVLFAYGKESENTAKKAEESGVKEVYHFLDENALADKISDILCDGDAILFKASRGMKLENVIESVYEKLENQGK
ncbi:MAG: UDP-N-acetylmuramoyl-tripeptide--D-alanyl-D-alanine ligase [Clostridia bacterium]|nr:UDP-N-acetylmuramoyl-tripeptide--D-alanyl-D-alanine ligase [Clostridia bacterium]